jgi:uncharacterized protein
VSSDLDALLAVQSDDAVVDDIERQLDALAPRLADLDRQRQVAEDALRRAEVTAEADEKKQRELERRLSEHKQRQERNLANLEVVKRMREATAAMAQVEQARKILIEEESELSQLVRRVAEDHRQIQLTRQALADLENATRAERETIASDRARLDTELKSAIAARDVTAQRVSRTLLAKYDRIRRRKGQRAVYPLRGQSCGNCDTSIPLQRRSAMTSQGIIEVCEACGVLLYAAEN